MSYYINNQLAFEIKCNGCNDITHYFYKCICNQICYNSSYLLNDILNTKIDYAPINLNSNSYNNSNIKINYLHNCAHVNEIYDHYLNCYHDHVYSLYYVADKKNISQCLKFNHSSNGKISDVYIIDFLNFINLEKNKNINNNYY